MTQNALQTMGIEILEWSDISLVSVNNRYAFRSSMIREPNLDELEHSQSPIIVTMYQFFNGDRSHTLTTEYRVSEAEMWRAPLEKVVNSFTITNVR
jgi:hypothetical protein